MAMKVKLELVALALIKDFNAGDLSAQCLRLWNPTLLTHYCIPSFISP